MLKCRPQSSHFIRKTSCLQVDQIGPAGHIVPSTVLSIPIVWGGIRHGGPGDNPDFCLGVKLRILCAMAVLLAPHLKLTFLRNNTRCQSVRIIPILSETVHPKCSIKSSTITLFLQYVMDR